MKFDFLVKKIISINMQICFTVFNKLSYWQDKKNY